MNNNLTIIIPTLNNTKGLQYLLSYFKEKPYKVAVVDNSKKNLGFAGGVNKGAKEAKTEWLLILNDDIEFKVKNEKLRVKNYNLKLKIENEETIQRLIKFAEENKLDAVSPILRNPDRRVENYGYKVLPLGRISLVEEKLTGSRVNELDGLTAACLLIKTEVFKKLGGFDEKFFAYLEDVDFFLRLAKLKTKPTRFSRRFAPPQPARFAICPDIEVLHNHMTTTRTMGNFKARQDMINWWRLYFKHPGKFKFDLNFIVERLRNVSGYLKATVNF